MTRSSKVDTIEVHELLESGSDGGEFMGLYAKGHHSKVSFAVACNRETGATDWYDRRYVTHRDVRHVYYRTQAIAGDPGEYAFVEAEKGPGAWAATVADPIEQERQKQRDYEQGRYLLGQAKGQREAVFEAMRFICARLDIDAAKSFASKWDEGEHVTKGGEALFQNIKYLHDRGLL